MGWIQLHMQHQHCRMKLDVQSLISKQYYDVFENISKTDWRQNSGVRNDPELLKSDKYFLSVMFFLDILLIKLFQHLHEIPVKQIGEPRMLRGIQKVMYTYNEWNPDILKCLLLKCHCYLHDSKKRPPVWTSTAIFVNLNVNVYRLTVLI